jgi:peptidoglycan/LPS O-acetylase OafA/YrhL
MKRAFLQAIIATLVVTALVGIYIFLFGTFGKTEAKILGTTATICYFCTTSLACSAAFEKKRHPALSLPGLVLGVLGLVFFIPSIWAEWFEVEAYAAQLS